MVLTFPTTLNTQRCYTVDNNDTLASSSITSIGNILTKNSGIQSMNQQIARLVDLLDIPSLSMSCTSVLKKLVAMDHSLFGVIDEKLDEISQVMLNNPKHDATVQNHLRVLIPTGRPFVHDWKLWKTQWK